MGTLSYNKKHGLHGYRTGRTRSGKGTETNSMKPWLDARVSDESVRKAAETRRAKRVKPSMPKLPWSD